MSEAEKRKEIHEVYETCRKVFEPSEEIMRASIEIEDKDEFEFYRMVHNYFMKKKQMEIVEKGIC